MSKITDRHKNKSDEPMYKHYKNIMDEKNYTNS